jgi:hypothetical protein
MVDYSKCQNRKVEIPITNLQKLFINYISLAVPKVPKNPLLQTKMPLKKVPPPTNATLAKRAADALSLRVNRLGEQLKNAKEKAMFGLDKMPAHGNEVVYIAEALTTTGKVNAQMVRRMLDYTGKTIYNGIWKASKAIQRLPPKTRATLLTIATVRRGKLIN